MNELTDITINLPIYNSFDSELNIYTSFEDDKFPMFYHTSYFSGFLYIFVKFLLQTDIRIIFF